MKIRGFAVRAALALSPILSALGPAAQAQSLTESLAPAVAPEEAGFLASRQTLGVGRLFTNDYLGDGRDRWRTGSYQVGVLRGQAWDGTLPTRPGAILEYRLRTEIIAPSAGTGPTGDRPYVGALSFGVFAPFAAGPMEASFGAEVTAIGPQTGLSDFQIGFHERFGMPAPVGTTAQLGDDVLFSASGELAWPVRLSPAVTVRPFAAAQVGVEDLVRLGGDIIVGGIGHDDLLIRDTVSGHLIRGIEGPATGASLLLGGDWAVVTNSAYLPEDQGFSAQDERFRLRAGVHWQLAEGISLFYGLTYLSEEFTGQPEGQILGGVKLNFNF